MPRSLCAWTEKYLPTQRDSEIAVLFGIVVILCLAFLGVKDATYFGDEGFHMEQIENFQNGNFTVTGSLTTIPGYHAFMTVASRLIGERSLAFYRLVNLLLSLLSVFVFFRTARDVRETSALEKTVQYAFLPIVLPFFFLLYTDILSLLLLLFALRAQERKGYALASIFSGIAILVRQNNIVWFGYFFIACLHETGMLRRITELIPLECIQRLARNLPNPKESAVHSANLLVSVIVYYLGFFLFAIFAKLNGGIAIGDKGSHPFPSFHLGNVYFLLFLLGILFLPMHLLNLKKIFRYLRTNRFAPTIVVSFFVIGMMTFVNTHGYNQGLDSVFLRNRILSYFTLTPLLKTLFFVPTTLALLSLLVTRFSKPIHYLLYPMTVLYLLPSWLIEQRYYFVPIVFFLLLRRDQSVLAERTQAIYSIVLSAVLYWIMATRWMFF